MDALLPIAEMWQHHPRIRQCIAELARGGVIAYPTEAVWGLGCDPFNERAIERVLALKHRSWKKGLIMVAADISQVDFLLEGIRDDARQHLHDSWPGHATWLVEHKGRVPRILSGEHDTIALRVSAHPVVQTLCRLYGGPIVSTSANPQGLQAARDATQVRRYFGADTLAISPGRVGPERRPSIIRDLNSLAVIRAN